MSGCVTPGCGNDAALNGKLGGRCIPCYNDDYNRRYRPDNGRASRPWGYKKTDESNIKTKTPESQEKEKDMTTKTATAEKTDPTPPKEKHKFCKGCLRHKKDVGRLYKGLCAECRSRPEAEPAPRHAETDAIPASEDAPIDHLKEQKIDPAIGKAILEGIREAELIIALDFKDHPELLQGLAFLAKKEFREPSGQAMAILDVYLNGAKNV